MFGIAEGQSLAKDNQVFNYPTYQSVLENGLKVITVPFDSPGIVSYYTIVRVGSRNEVEPGHSGFAHFFEHMMFRGTEKYPKETYNNDLKSIGADHNAFTDNDMTVYHILASSRSLDTLMQLESDRFMNLKYSEEDFKTEAGAILGEYNKNFSSPMETLFEKMQDTAYVVHPYKHTTIGFLNDIMDMPNQFDYSLQFFDRWYRPENCALIVVGDVQKRASTDSCKEIFWRMETRQLPRCDPSRAAQTKEKLDQCVLEVGDPSNPGHGLPWARFQRHIL